MGKKIVFQILNGFRIVSFWIFMALLVVSVMEAVRESKVKITVKDGVLGEVIHEGPWFTEFQCTCDGESIQVTDTEGRKKGDKVQLIFRNGRFYSLRSTEFPENGVEFWNRVNYRFTMATGGNLFFTFIAYVFFFLITIKARKGFRKEYPILFIVTHVCGLLSVFLFYIWCYWLEFINLIFYAVVFAFIWIIRVIVKQIRFKKQLRNTEETD